MDVVVYIPTYMLHSSLFLLVIYITYQLVNMHSFYLHR